MTWRASRHRMSLRAVLARWDAVVIRWELDAEERTAVIGGFAGGPIDRIDSYEPECAEERMRLVVELEPLLTAFYGDEGRVRAWLRAPNRHLDDRTPIEMMASSPEWMRWFIRNMGMAS